MACIPQTSPRTYALNAMPASIPAYHGSQGRMSDDENKTCVLRQFEELLNKGQIDSVEDFFAEAE